MSWGFWRPEGSWRATRLCQVAGFCPAPRFEPPYAWSWWYLGGAGLDLFYFIFNFSESIGFMKSVDRKLRDGGSLGFS